MPVGAGSFAEAAAGRREIFHALRGILKGAASRPGWTMRGLRAELKSNQEPRSRPRSRRKTARGGGRLSRWTSRPAWLGPAAAYVFKKSGERSHLRRDDAALRRLVRAVSDRRRSKTVSPKAMGRLEGADQRASGDAMQLSATTCSSPTRDSRAGIADQVGNACS
jgi:hypothetical protein